LSLSISLDSAIPSNTRRSKVEVAGRFEVQEAVPPPEQFKKAHD
jgi:hypothetical protein